MSKAFVHNLRIMSLLQDIACTTCGSFTIVSRAIVINLGRYSQSPSRCCGCLKFARRCRFCIGFAVSFLFPAISRLTGTQGLWWDIRNWLSSAVSPLPKVYPLIMEGSKVGKRTALDDSDARSLEPILVKIDKSGYAPHDICIDKNEFRIGRGRDNDEIILDVMISRRHCLLRCEGNEEWVIKDLSSSAIYVNDVPLNPGVSQRIHDGDIIQFTMSNAFKYKFTLTPREEQKVKRLKLDEQIFDNVLIEQKTFAESQECQKRVLKDKLQTKQKEQDELKQQLEFLLKQQSATIEDAEDLRKQITMLEGRIESGNVQEQYLRSNYAELLEKLDNERVLFEIRLDAEKQKWQDALKVSNQEKQALEVKMGEQMEKWRVEQQAEWKSVMESRVKEEKNIQAQLMNEKTVLEEKLKETEKALKEQEAKVETIQNNVAGPSDNSANNCIFLEFVNDPSTFPILETIDLTIDTQFGAEPEKKETVLNRVSDIMDEQLTCSICSELFVKATTLNCMHTFCHYCIVSWNKKRKECPVCRARVAAMNRSIVLDNFIESMLENLPTTTKDRRNELIEERKGLERKRDSSKIISGKRPNFNSY